VKFLYCPECGALQSRSWRNWTRCPLCHEDATIISVRPGPFGIVMWATSIIATVLIALLVLGFDLGFGSRDASVVLLFIVISFVCGYFEIRRAEKIAKERINDKRLE
jgi:hypothetical protein